MKISIKAKLTTFLALLLLTTITVLSILVLNGIEENQRTKYEEYLMHQTKIANIYIQQNYIFGEKAELNEFMKKQGQKLTTEMSDIIGLNVALYDSSGTMVGNSDPLSNKFDVKDLLEYSEKGKISYETIQDSIIYVAPINSVGKRIGAIQFTYPLNSDIEFYNTIKYMFYKIGMLIFLISFILGYFYYNKFASDVLKLKEAVNKIKNGIYVGKNELRTKDELGELSQGIYYMSNEIKNNIYELQSEQEKLKLAVVKLQALEKQQKHFIENITHEFKTPLTSIKAYVDLLDLYKDDPKLLEDARKNIGSESGRLYEMVEKVLRLASLEKYDFELHPQVVEVKEELLYICERMNGKIKKFDLKLENNLEPVRIYVDRESFLQIFINLVDNAVKYNIDSGRIILSNYVIDNKVYIEVKDTGIGIPAESVNKIFDPFYTSNKDRSRKTGGTGLGLSLVKQLVEKQKGTIELKETSENGTTFVVSFNQYQ